VVGQHVGHVGALGADLSALEDHRPRGQECGLRRGDPEGGVAARVEGVELDETPAARAVPGAVVLGAVARAALRLPVVGTARDGDIAVIAQPSVEGGSGEFGGGAGEWPFGSSCLATYWKPKLEMPGWPLMVYLTV
jgi:hypothetical protein